MTSEARGHSTRIAACLCVLLGCQPQAGSTPEPTAGTSGRGGTGGQGGTGGSASAGQGGSAAAGTGGGGGSGASAGSAGGSIAGSTGGASAGTGGSVAAGSGGAGGGSSDAGEAGAGVADAGGSAPEAGGPAAGSAGCGRNNPGGTFMITAGNAQTPYRVVLPGMYDPSRPYPVVFYLHGRGNNIEGQGNLTREVAGDGRAIVVYPKSFGGSGWEVPGRDRPEENLALLRALIQHLGQQYCVDKTRIVMTGFSSGCWFASRLACTMKDELAGVVAAACGLDPMGRCPDRKPITYIIGRGDSAFGGAAAAADFYRTRNGCQSGSQPAATAPCLQYQGCAAGMNTNYCPHPGGHMWPAFGARSVLELLEKL